jgi:hypothetical protein
MDEEEDCIQMNRNSIVALSRVYIYISVSKIGSIFTHLEDIKALSVSLNVSELALSSAGLTQKQKPSAVGGASLLSTLIGFDVGVGVCAVQWVSSCWPSLRL